MPDLRILLNPTAGRGKRPAAVEQAVVRLQTEWPGPVETVESRSKGDEERIARETPPETRLVVVGGDGTFGNVARVRAETSGALGLIPAGTGNDFARSLGFYPKSDAWVSQIVADRPRAVDLIAIQSGSLSTTTINVAGTGFDAAVAARINQGFRWVTGPLAYILATLTTLRTFQPASVQLRLDDQPTFDGDAYLVSLANTATVGGGMRVAPAAVPTDGRLDVVVIGRVSRGEFVRTLPKVFSGRHVEHPAVHTWSGLKAQIDCPAEWWFYSDGEVRGQGSLTAQIHPGAVSVLLAPPVE